MAKAAAPKKPLSKKQLIDQIMSETGLGRKDVTAVFDSLYAAVANGLSKKGAGTFVLPGMLKIEKKKVPAKKARKNVPNPFTGELRDVPAKPAHNVIKIKALKNLKELA
ncbi:MAG: HU family DNA-binding protein [Planctomycetia bacterium]|nr:HU family DNA-binding protein [Planctomycetia bacterium]